jgi:hypothetical protein
MGISLIYLVLMISQPGRRLEVTDPLVPRVYLETRPGAGLHLIHPSTSQVKPQVLLDSM